MIASNEHPDFHRLSTEVTDLFRGYGQDLAMRGAEPHIQRWGLPELYIAAIPVLAWIIQTVSKAIIDSWVKTKLSKPQEENNKNKQDDSKRDAEIAELKQRVADLQSLTSKALKEGLDLTDRMDYLEKTWNLTIDILPQKETEESIITFQSFDELVPILQDIGLTERHAHQFVEKTQAFLLSAFPDSTGSRGKG